MLDLGSANGTTVNGGRIERHELGPEDRVGIGKFELTLIEPPDVSDPDPTILLQPGAAASPGAPGGALYLVGDGQSVPLSGEVTIGKTRGVDVRARGLWVKPVHVRLITEGPGVHRLTCPGDAGVQLNGTQVSTAYLKAGDELVVGRSRFIVSTGISSYRLFLALLQEIDVTPRFGEHDLVVPDGEDGEEVAQEALWDVVFSRLAGLQEYGWHAGIEDLSWITDSLDGSLASFNWKALRVDLNKLRETWTDGLIRHAKENDAFFPEQEDQNGSREYP